MKNCDALNSIVLETPIKSGILFVTESFRPAKSDNWLHFLVLLQPAAASGGRGGRRLAAMSWEWPSLQAAVERSGITCVKAPTNVSWVGIETRGHVTLWCRMTEVCLPLL